MCCGYLSCLGYLGNELNSTNSIDTINSINRFELRVKKQIRNEEKGWKEQGRMNNGRLEYWNIGNIKTKKPTGSKELWVFYKTGLICILAKRVDCTKIRNNCRKNLQFFLSRGRSITICFYKDILVIISNLRFFRLLCQYFLQF